MVAKKEIAPELLAEAKRLYEQTAAPVGDIAEMVGLSRSNFYERVREGKWRSRRAKPTFSMARAISAAVRAAPAIVPSDPPNNEPPKVLSSAPTQDAATDMAQQQRLAIAQRIMTTVEREMDAIERILKTITPADPLEAEHGARTLASLSRTLRDIAALNRPDDETPPDDTDDDDDPVPQDIDEFRNELARRIRGILARRRSEGGIAGGTDAVLD